MSIYGGLQKKKVMNKFDRIKELWSIGLDLKWYKCIIFYTFGIPLLLICTVLEVVFTE